MKTNPNDCAYPNEPYIESHARGLTKREYFAAMAMQGILANSEMGLDTQTWIADEAILQADALIEQLNKGDV